jgi:hypothetical protein
VGESSRLSQICEDIAKSIIASDGVFLSIPELPFTRQNLAEAWFLIRPCLYDSSVASKNLRTSKILTIFARREIVDQLIGLAEIALNDLAKLGGGISRT